MDWDEADCEIARLQDMSMQVAAFRSELVGVMGVSDVLS